jgi:hypothetical protein
MNIAYKYRIKPPTQHEEEVEEQFVRARRYQNACIALERDVRHETLKHEYAESQRTYEQLTKAEKTLAQLKKEDTDTKQAEKAVRLAKREHMKAKKVLKEAWATTTIAEDRKTERQKASDEGLYWGTYLTVDRAVDAASETGAPKFRKWDGSGRIANQIQKGIPVTDLFEKGKNQVRITGEGKKRELHFRISKGRDPVWAVFPLIYHRDLPPSALVKWVTVHREKVATKFIWHVVFSLDVQDKRDIAIPAPTKDTIGVNIGWRIFPDEGIRVAYWYDDEGNHGQLLVPQRIWDRWKKTEDLQSIRQKEFNDHNKFLVTLRKAEKETWPKWLIDDTTHAHAWLSPVKLAKLVVKWRHNRFPGDEDTFEILEAWRKQDKHLYEWERNQQRNVLSARQYLYRHFARKVAQYKHIMIDDLDLRHFAELPGADDEPDDPITKAARPRRFKVCLSSLLHEIVHMAKKAGGIVSEADPANLTKACWKCESLQHFDAARELKHECSICGTRWDQDYNHARNLVRVAPHYPDPGKRSQGPKRNEHGETRAEERRRKSLETRREQRQERLSQIEA